MHELVSKLTGLRWLVWKKPSLSYSVRLRDSGLHTSIQLKAKLRASALKGSVAKFQGILKGRGHYKDKSQSDGKVSENLHQQVRYRSRVDLHKTFGDFIIQGRSCRFKCYEFTFSLITFFPSIISRALNSPFQTELVCVCVSVRMCVCLVKPWGCAAWQSHGRSLSPRTEKSALVFLRCSQFPLPVPGQRQTIIQSTTTGGTKYTFLVISSVSIQNESNVATMLEIPCMFREPAHSPHYKES